MIDKEFDKQLRKLFREQEEVLNKTNKKVKTNNGIYSRYKRPVLTAKHAPLFWRYDLDRNSNPELLERLGINTTFNAGAILFEGRYLIIARVEGFDVKSFFAVAESPNGIDKFKFWDHPVLLPVTDDPEMNVYDIRLTNHEDGWIYGLFCAERKDTKHPEDSSAAIASCGIARTKDLISWERLEDLKSTSSQQRNCVLHPEFVKGKYAFYTRPQDGFIDTGANSGISWGLSDNIQNAKIKEQSIIDPRQYHTVKEVKNGLGPPPIKTKKGWLHLAHGVRRTASGLRYVLYLFLSDLSDPSKIIAMPGGHFLAPEGKERVGDVSNVVFSNGWIKKENDEILIYYASSDTRIHVAETSITKLLDYVKNTPTDAGFSNSCVSMRDKMINKNLDILKREFPDLKY